MLAFSVGVVMAMSDSLTPMCRRSLLRSSSLAAAVVCSRALTDGSVLADASVPSLASGTVALQAGASLADVDGAALYVTVRPATSDGAAALQAGKVVPLATTRYANPSFPFQFQLTTADLTEEYKALDVTSYDTLDLLVSARWDGDGVAATRGPDDLVGRGLLKKNGSRDVTQWRAASVQLQGRGLTGRFLTGGK